MWWTSTIIQIIVISTYWSRDAFTLMLNLTSATTLIPYFLVAAYGLMIARRGETYEAAPRGAAARSDARRRRRAVHDLHAHAAGGLRYILLAAILFAPGTIQLLHCPARAGQAGVRRDERLGSSA